MYARQTLYQLSYIPNHIFLFVCFFICRLLRWVAQVAQARMELLIHLLQLPSTRITDRPMLSSHPTPPSPPPPPFSLGSEKTALWPSRCPGHTSFPPPADWTGPFSLSSHSPPATVPAAASPQLLQHTDPEQGQDRVKPIPAFSWGQDRSRGGYRRGSPRFLSPVGPNQAGIVKQT